MNTDLAIRGSLDSLPDKFSELEFLQALGSHGLNFEDSRLLMQKAELDGFVGRVTEGGLEKLRRALAPSALPPAG